MTMAQKRGTLIVIEGLDRAGKSTQVQLLIEKLNEASIKAESIRFPDRSTPIGNSVDAYLKGQTNINDQVIHLLFSANRWEAAEGIKAKLELGVTLVVDRYSFSGAVYSAAKRNPAIDLDWAWNMEIGLPQPDLVIYLTVSPQVQAVRGGFGEERYENDTMQKAVRSTFEALWPRYIGELQVVDADADVQTVSRQMLDQVTNTIHRTHEPLKTLQKLK